MGIISLPDKTTRNFFRVLPLQRKKKNNFPFSYQLSQVSLFQVSNLPLYLFPLSRILRSLSQSIRTILHSTRQTLQSISYRFGTRGIYSTFYISIDFFVFYFFLFFWGCYRR